ncbi:MAG: DUF1259 domain-containing protein [Gemmatimonas sp.]
MRSVWIAVAFALSVSQLGAQAGAAAVPANGGPQWATVQQALGGKGTMQSGDVLKFGFPRSDLQVTAEGVALKPAFALGSWVAFKRMSAAADADVMAMGDLVLTEEEVGPVMLALQQNGVEQTALHNHVLRESPRIMYMHIAAHGDAAKIANAIHTALLQSKTPIPQAATAPAPQASAPAINLDTVAVAQALGFAGKGNGGVFQFSIPRSETITDNGMTIPPSMGVATAINFQPTGGGKAAITGDFVMTAGEVNKVIRALRDHNIQVTALHSHMLTESPRLFFMHFWANADAVALAKGLRAALDQTAVKRATK